MKELISNDLKKKDYHKVEIDIDEMFYITSEEDEEKENISKHVILGKLKSQFE